MATTPEQIVESLMELTDIMIGELSGHKCENTDDFIAQRREIQEQINQMKGGEQEQIDTAHIVKQVKKALEIQFESYTWDNMIDDCGLTKAENEWAKLNLTYMVIVVPPHRS